MVVSISGEGSRNVSLLVSREAQPIFLCGETSGQRVLRAEGARGAEQAARDREQADEVGE